LSINTLIKTQLSQNQYKWLVTGVAGFIGSNLLESLLKNDQIVIGIDNLETGFFHNLDEVQKSVSPKQWKNFIFHEQDITNFYKINSLFKNIDFVLHQAALGSVPRSIKDPLKTNEANISGFLNVIQASTENSVKSFIFAASSSTYGDHLALPKKEEIIGKPLSPYAITKYANELYAGVYSKHFNIKTVGLRYFNVFGRRQDPNGAYAAVIPKWIGSMINNEDIFINGDGSTTRDFCYVDNAVQANLLSALNFGNLHNDHNIFNVAFGESNSLITLFNEIKNSLEAHGIKNHRDPIFRDFRDGDIKDSLADITKAQSLIHYDPMFNLSSGLKETIQWFVSTKNNIHD
jgi:UDP-N-acetylglucosamine 4-epimerase